MPHPLFIYGTLHPDRAPAAIAATARLLKPMGRATIQGCLYDLGEYPGVILDPSEQGQTIWGELFVIPQTCKDPDPDAILSRLDAYEDFRAADPTSSLFLRKLALARREDGTEVLSWVYNYNRPVL